MGSMQAQEMRERLELDQALSWHLQYNHFPPVPLVWLPICKEVIQRANESYMEYEYIDFGDLEFDNPTKPGKKISASRVYEGLSLDNFVG